MNDEAIEVLLGEIRDMSRHQWRQAERHPTREGKNWHLGYVNGLKHIKRRIKYYCTDNGNKQ